jgi:hypothetical protein
MTANTPASRKAKGREFQQEIRNAIIKELNLDENDLADQAFLRRMGYRARVEPPTPGAYSEIFKRQAYTRGIRYQQAVLDHVLDKYKLEHRQMKGCEPRDLLDRATDICLFEGQSLELTTPILDIAWRNYFGTAHSFDQSHRFTPGVHDEALIDRDLSNPLEL